MFFQLSVESTFSRCIMKKFKAKKVFKQSSSGETRGKVYMTAFNNSAFGNYLKFNFVNFM